MKEVKEINFEKDVVKTTKYRYPKIVFEIFEYKVYKDAREKGGQSIQKRCFICNRAFLDEDKLSLLFDGNKDNKLCCDQCAREID